MDTQGFVGFNAQHRVKLGVKSRPASGRRRIKLGAVVLRCTTGVAASVDVAIVGGGPGGLASAAALVSAFGCDVRVKVLI